MAVDPSTIMQNPLTDGGVRDHERGVLLYSVVVVVVL